MENSNENNCGRELMNMFRQFKLGNSLFRYYYRASRQEVEYWKDSALDYKAVIHNDIRQKLADYILIHQQFATRETNLENGGLEIQSESLVLKMDEFKTLVEAAIQMIPDDKIQEIKKGKPILF